MNGKMDRGAQLIDLARRMEDKTLSPAECKMYEQTLLSQLRPDDVRLLERHLGQDQEHQVRTLAVATLGRTGSPDAIRPLDVIIENRHEHSELRRVAVWALSRIPDVKVIPYLGKVLTDGEETSLIRWTAAEALRKLALPKAAPFLGQALQDPDPMVQRTAASALLMLDAPEAAQDFRRALETTQDPEVKKAAATALGRARDANAIHLLGRALAEDENPGVRQAAAEALGEIGDVGAVPYLNQALQEYQDAATRLVAAKILGNIHHAKAVEVLCETVVSAKGRRFCEQLAYSIRSNKAQDWIGKTRRLIELLEEGGQQRGQIDGAAIAYAMRPPEEALLADRYLLTDYLIEQARGRDRRMTSILAKLIIQSAEENPLLAGERVNEYQKAHQIPEDQLRELRIEIGGETALDPIMKTLQHNLDKYFQQPIAKLNEDTRVMWQRTMLYAQIGFIVRQTWCPKMA